MEKSSLVQVAIDIALALSPVIVSLLGLVALKLRTLLQAKVKNEYLQGALCRLNDLVFTEVKAMQQLVVDDLKAANADGILTDEEKAAIKADVLGRVKEHIGVKGIKELLTVLGVDSSVLDKFLGSKVEVAVASIKEARPL